MTVSVTSTRTIYSGDDSTTVFNFTVPFQNESEVIVILRDETTATAITETTQTSGVDYTTSGSSGNYDITMTTAPTSTQKLVVKRVVALTQPTDFQDNAVFSVEEVETALDKLTFESQQQKEQLDRSLKVPETNSTFDATIPEPVANTLLIVNDAGTAYETVTTAGLQLDGGSLGLPTDGIYGVTESVSGIAEGDSIEDAFDKHEELLSKLAPASPPDLSTKTLRIANTYSAIDSTTTAPTLTNVITDTQPNIQTYDDPADLQTDGFADADSGTLTATVDASTVGTITLSTSDDTGTNGDLEVVDDDDFYLGVSGQAGIFNALLARIAPQSALALGSHTAVITHSDTGSTPTFTFHVDDSQTPTVGATAVTSPELTTTQISGVDCLTTGSIIRPSFTVTNAIGQHYNATAIASATSSVTDTVNAALPVAAPGAGSVFTVNSGDIDLTVQASQFSADVSVTCTGTSANPSDTDSSAVTNNIRVDSISDETQRVKSGTGQFPAIGVGAGDAGDTYDSTELLTANEELQLENATFKFPAATDYTGNIPAGPNYSAITGGSFNNNRWATFQLGPVSSVVNVTVTFGGTSGFSSVIESNFELYVLVDGATPTAGWVDGNAAYPGVGDPTNDGDAALVVGSSTATSKVVTFGSSVKTGDVYVRVGIPSGDAKTFQTVSIS